MRRYRAGLTLIEGLVVAAILVLITLFLLPLYRGGAREPARRNVCLNQLKQIALALHAYHDDQGHFPPAYTVDDEGERLHSWRTLLLPYLEENELYEAIDLTKPWDDPVNEAARKETVRCYECPSTDIEEGMTNYLVLVGSDWAFAGEPPRSLDDIEDGPRQTVCLVEADQTHAVHWMSPQDFEASAGLPFDEETVGGHPGVNLAVFFDGHSGSLPRDIDPEELKAMLTIAGGEAVEE